MTGITLEFSINFQRTGILTILIFQSMNIVYLSIHFGHFYFSKKYFAVLNVDVLHITH